MKKSKIADTLYAPIKDGKYLINGKGIVRVYKSEEILQKYCKDYDDTIIYNKLFRIKEIEELVSENKILAKALELAVADKCKFENEWLSMVVGMPNGKLLVPKKEQE